MLLLLCCHLNRYNFDIDHKSLLIFSILGSPRKGFHKFFRIKSLGVLKSWTIREEIVFSVKKKHRMKNISTKRRKILCRTTSAVLEVAYFFLSFFSKMLSTNSFESYFHTRRKIPPNSWKTVHKGFFLLFFQMTCKLMASIKMTPKIST